MGTNVEGASSAAARHVLLVEDDNADARLVCELLRDVETTARFEIEHVGTIEDARNLMQRHRFDLVLLDLGLPGCAGADAVEHLRRAGLRAPIVVLTGSRDPKIGSRALRDAEVLVSKHEIDGRGLARAIEHALAQVGARDPRRSNPAFERKIAAVLGPLPWGVIVTDDAGFVLYANPGAASLLGRTDRDLHGGAFGPIVPSPAPRRAELRCGDAEPVIVELFATEIVWEEQPARLVTLRPAS